MSDEQTKREPIIGYEVIQCNAQLATVRCQPDANPAFMHELGSLSMRDEYENEITEGRLMVAMAADQRGPSPTSSAIWLRSRHRCEPRERGSV